MILGIGTDLCNIDRIAAVLDRHGDRFRQRVFTETELARAARRPHEAATLAKRWAAKEACSKALGTGLRTPMSEIRCANWPVEDLAVDVTERRAAEERRALVAARAGVSPDVLCVGKALTGGVLSFAATLAPGSDGVADVVRRIRDHATVSYDPNIRPAVIADPEAYRRRFRSWMSSVDVVKLSDEDAAWLADGPHGTTPDRKSVV